MARLQVSLQNLGAIDEDSDYTPANSPSRSPGLGNSFAQNAYQTPASGPSYSEQSFTPYSPSTGGSPQRFSFSRHGSTTEFNDELQDDDMMSSAMGDDSERDSDDDDDQKKGWINPDILYQDEFLYWLVKLLRGSTAGRRIKRSVFKISIVGIVCSVALAIIAYLEARLYSFSSYFNTSPYGMTLQGLMNAATTTEAFMSVMSLIFIKYWASVVTNRKLFIQLIRLYMIMQLVTVIIGMWMLGILYKTFQGITRWNDDLTLAKMFPYVLCTWLFGVPYLLVTVYYVLDISSYINDLILDVGVIDEPDPPPDRVDLSDVSIKQVMILMIAFPFMLLMQVVDLIIALSALFNRYIHVKAKERRELQVKRAEMKAAKIEKTKGSTIWVRIVRTLQRRLRKLRDRCCCKKPALPVLDTTLDNVPASPYARKPAVSAEALEANTPPADANERELRERLAREKATLEEEKRAAMKAAEVKARLELEATRLREEREREEEFARAELDRKLEEEKKDAAPTLDVPRFKALWNTLPTTGSFNAKLRTVPSLAGLTEHMRKQGFHVVFASAPTSAEIELGVCCVRERPSDVWFVARFVASPTDFNAVMRCADADVATRYVKKFSLAKVLKIDTSRTQVASPQR